MNTTEVGHPKYVYKPQYPHLLLNAIMVCYIEYTSFIYFVREINNTNIKVTK